MRPSGALPILGGLTVVLALGAAAAMPLLPDEAYYWTWSRALGASYFDHPPAIAGIAWISNLFGTTPLALRATSLAFWLGAAALSIASARRVGARTETALGVLLGAPAFTVALVPLTPDPLLALLVALEAHLVVRAFTGRPPGAWLGLGAALALLAKHSAAILAAGAALGAASTPEGRRRLGAPATALGIAAGLLALSPWLDAELRAPASSFEFQLHRTLDRSSPGLAAAPVALGGLALAFGPRGLLALARLPTRADALERVLGGGALALVLASVVALALGRAELNWLVPAFVFAAPVLARRAESDGALLRALGLGLAAATLVFLAHAIAPFLPLAPDHDPVRRGSGWAEIAEGAAALATEPEMVVVTTRYQRASLLRLHLGDRRPVLETHPREARGSQFDRWPHPTVCRDQRFVWVGMSDPPAGLQPATLEAARVVQRTPRERFRIERWRYQGAGCFAGGAV